MALGMLAGLGCFVLGLVAARFLGTAPPPAPVEPRIFIDPGSIQLLPDASLHLDLSLGLDGGLGP